MWASISLLADLKSIKLYINKYAITKTTDHQHVITITHALITILIAT